MSKAAASKIRTNILVTGATGFVGGALLRQLLVCPDYVVSAALRTDKALEGCDTFNVGEISSQTDWSRAVKGQDVVIHAAARAHVLADKANDPLEEFRRINVEGTHNLATQAAQAGVGRFVFISSIGVNGNANTRPFTEADTPHPMEPYAQSKWEAEKRLWDIHRETGMEVVIIRPPLVYGPNAPGNFGSLMRWIEKGIPLPLGAVHNQRSLVALDNLVSGSDSKQTLLKHGF